MYYKTMTPEEKVAMEAKKREIATKAVEECDVVFVYGSLRQGLHNHAYVSGEWIEEGGVKPERLEDTTIDGFEMYPISVSFSTGFYPFCVEGTGKVMVEAYKVDASAMIDLDGLEGYPDFYERKIVTAGNGQKGWVYYLDLSVAKNQNTLAKVLKYKVADGNWREFYRNNLGAYINGLYKDYKNLCAIDGIE